MTSGATELRTPDPDRTEIDLLTHDFFAAFSNRGGSLPQLERLRGLFIAEAVIVKNAGPAPEVYGLEDFIAPRKAMLEGGRLREFAEAETESTTTIVGRIAQRICFY